MIARVAFLPLLLVVLSATWLAGCVMQGVPQDNLNANSPPVNEVDQSLANRAPVAAAGPDQAARSGEVVTLNGTGSSDPDNNQLSFVWRQVDGSPDVEFQSTPSASIVTFVAPQVAAPTDFRFSLAVVDGFAARFDEVIVTVSP